MMDELLIYQQNVIDTYLYFIRENLSLIRSIYSKKEKLFDSYDPSQKSKFYISRAKHIQIMTLIGLTAEHLIKIVLLKRGFVLNTSDIDAKFEEQFMQELEQKNKTKITKAVMEDLYFKSEKNVNVSFRKNLKDFDACIALYNNSNATNYYDTIGTYLLNPNPKVYNNSSYMGYKQICSQDILKVIQKMRNSYLHLAEAKAEQQGIVWYLFNFLIWLGKKEYPNFFKREKMIGSDANKMLFGS